MPISRPVVKGTKKAAGRLLTFIGAKGGAGATTIACNFAVALAQDPNQKTLLIDLDLPLGDAALNLGIAAEYSTINALQSTNRLDASFLSQLLVKHSSGVSVLAAPGKFIPYETSDEAIDRLFEASGATALANDAPVQRFWRDAHAGRVHAANDPERAYVIFGNNEFGLPPGDTMV